MFNLLLVLAFYLPLQLAINPIEGVDLASGRVFILGLFLLWIVDGLKKKKLFFSKKISTVLLLSFLFLNVFSLVVARNSDWSLRKLMFIFSIAPIYFVSQVLLNTKEKKQKLIQGLVYGALLSSLVGIFQFVAQFIIGRETVYIFWANYLAVPFLGKSFSQAVLLNPSWLVNIAGETYLRATAFFPDPHMFSFFLGLVIPLAIGITMVSSRRKIFNFLVVLVLIIADGLTFSRGGYLGLAVGFVFLLLIFWQKIAKKYKLAIIMLAIISVTIMLVPSPINQRFSSIFNLTEGSNKGRIEIWGQAIKVVEKSPWLGVGIGNYPLEIKASADYREPIYAHNTYLDITAETGMVSLFFWVGFLLLNIYELYKKQNKLLVFASVSLVIFAVHSLVETGIYSATVLPIFLIISSLNNDND